MRKAVTDDYPYYDGTPPHVKGSDTSLIAAEEIKEPAGAIRRRIWNHVLDYDYEGRTCDEVEADLGIIHTTCSARIRELALDGRLIGTKRRRLTRHKCPAVVYIGTTKPVPLVEESVDDVPQLLAKIAELELQNELLREHIAELESQLEHRQPLPALPLAEPTYGALDL